MRPATHFHVPTELGMERARMGLRARYAKVGLRYTELHLTAIDGF